MSLDSESNASSDPEINAALGPETAAPDTATVSNDPEIQAALAADEAPARASKGGRVGWAEENIAGPSEVIGGAIANIPHMAAHGAVDIYRSLFDRDKLGTPDPEIVRRLEVPTLAGGRQLLSDLSNLPRSNANLPDDTNVPQFGDTTQSVIGHTLRVAGDVGGIAGGTQLVRGIFGGVPKLGATGAPEAAAADAQAVANEAAAGQSIGAAGAGADVSTASPELQAAVKEAGPGHNTEVLARHLDAEKLPLPEGETPLRLRRGQATQDPQQISDEKNLRADPDTEGVLTNSIKDQNDKLGESIGEIRRRATPDIVQRNNLEHGQVAIDAIKAQDNAAVLDTRAKYKALADANGGSIPIDSGAAIEDIDAKLEKGFLTETANKNSVVSAITTKLRSGNPLTFEQFENARTRLAEVQRAGGSDAAAAGIVRTALENMPMPPEAAPLKGLADTARAAAKARFDTIEQNPAYKAAIEDNVQKDKNGLHVVGAESPLAGSFLDRFALGNGPNADAAYVSRLKNTVKDPALSQAIEAAALNKLRDAAGIDALGHGNFRNNTYRNAVNGMAPKAKALLSPESIENTERLKRISGLVTDESPAGSTNRPNTALTLQRFGAMFEKPPSVTSDVVNAGADVAVGHTVGPAGVFGKNIVQKMLKGSQEAKAAQALKDAKLKFAQDAIKPGAGLDYKQ